MASPFKTIEFDLETPYKKKIVDNQINSWMETCVKKTESLRRPKLPCKFTVNYSLNRKEQLSKFRKYKNSLVLQALQKFTQKTAASQSQNNRYTPSPEYFHRKGKTTEIQVRQFSEKQTHEVISFNQNTKIALLKLPLLPNRRKVQNLIAYEKMLNQIVDESPTIKSYIPSRYLLGSIGKI